MSTNSRAAFASSQAPPTRALSRRLGLQLVGERALTADEITELERETRKYKKRCTILGWLTFLVFLSPFLFGFLVWTFFPGSSAPRYDRITDLVVGFILIPLISTGVLFWMLYDEGQRRGAQGLGWDLRAGVVLQFQGRAQEFKNSRFAARTFPQNATEETGHLVEVLPHAQRLWKMDGVVVEPWKMVDKVPKPAPPLGVVIDEVLASSTPKTLPSSVAVEVLGERDLTFSESEELERQLKSPAPSNVFLQGSIMLPLMFGGRMLLDHFLNNKPFFFSPSLLLIPGACLLIWVVSNFFGLQARYGLRLDIYKNRVLIVHIPTTPYARPVSQQGINLEILPNTRWVLTSEGKPPRWRTGSRQIKQR